MMNLAAISLAASSLVCLLTFLLGYWVGVAVGRKNQLLSNTEQLPEPYRDVLDQRFIDWLAKNRRHVTGVIVTRDGGCSSIVSPGDVLKDSVDPAAETDHAIPVVNEPGEKPHRNSAFNALVKQAYRTLDKWETESREQAQQLAMQTAKPDDDLPDYRQQHREYRKALDPRTPTVFT